MRKRASLLVAVVVLSAVTNACSSMSTNGPLAVGGGSEICAPSRDEGFTAFGEVVTNEGDRDLTLAQPTLITPEGLQHEESYVMLIEGMADRSSGMVLGVASTTPGSPAEAAAWERRKVFEEFTLKPGESANVIIALSLSNPNVDGKAEGFRMVYSDGSRDFTADTSNRIVLTGQERCV